MKTPIPFHPHASTFSLPRPFTSSLPFFFFFLFFFSSLLCVTSSSSDLPVSSSSYPVPVPDLHHHVYLSPPSLPSSSSTHKRDVVHYKPWPKTNATVLHRKRGGYSERLELAVTEASVNWIQLRWSLQVREGGVSSDSAEEREKTKTSRVTCELGNSTLVDHLIHGPGNQYRISDLIPDTEYLVCVETETVSGYLHYRCAFFRTEAEIENPKSVFGLRPDSVLGLLLSVGYVCLMSLIGYITWVLRRRRYFQSSNRGGGAGSSAREEEVELSCRTSTVRVSEIEERVQLNSVHGPSPAAGPGAAARAHHHHPRPHTYNNSSGLI